MDSSSSAPPPSAGGDGDGSDGVAVVGIGSSSSRNDNDNGEGGRCTLYVPSPRHRHDHRRRRGQHQQQQQQQQQDLETSSTTIPVTYNPASTTREEAVAAVRSELFKGWLNRCFRGGDDVHRGQDSKSSGSSSSSGSSKSKYIDVRGVEIQSVDTFGARGVGFLKVKSDCVLAEEEMEEEEEEKEESEDGQKQQQKQKQQKLPGICFLRGNSVAILTVLYVPRKESEGRNHDDDDEEMEAYALLVEQPRVPAGTASCLELPAGMIDDESTTIAGVAIQEMREECGIRLGGENSGDGNLVDLTEIAFGGGGGGSGGAEGDGGGFVGVTPSPGGCDERSKLMYLEKRATRGQLDAMRGRLAGLREHGELIRLHVVKLDDAWRISADMKAMATLFLVEQLRKEGKLPPPGKLATPLDAEEPSSPVLPPPRRPPPPVAAAEPDDDENDDATKDLRLNTRQRVPRLAFGLYKVPPTPEGERIILEAARAGYRHFDTASYYGNEAALGNALRHSGIPRGDFFVSSKVWNDAVKGGRAAVRDSVERSLRDLNFGGYFDLFYVHWPVPNRYVDAYLELEDLHREGKIRAIGLSNFSVEEYEQLAPRISIPPAVNQFEVSPLMYRPQLVNYFRERGIAVAASKALNRAACLDREPIVAVARKHRVTPAQVLLRWSCQKGLIVVSKTSSGERMKENRSVLHFALSDDDVALLDSLTTEEDVRAREELEVVRKKSM